MALSVASRAAPAWLSRNWINQESVDYGTFTASEMQALLARVIDGDPLSKWNGSTESDGTEVTLTFSLQDLGVLASRAVDLVLCQNVNWKHFVVEYSTNGGASYTPFSGGDYAASNSPATTYTGTDLQLALPAQVTGVQYIRARITHTQTANQTKRLGGIIAAELKLQTAQGDAILEPDYREQTDVVMLGNGNETRDYTLRSAQSHLWWGHRGELLDLTDAELATLFAIKTAGEPLVYYPRPGDDVRAAYLCHFGADGWRPRRMSKAPGAGWRLPYTLREVRDSA